MGFKTVDQYNEEKYGGLFVLRNHHDAANVIFLYRDKKDVLVADTHYIKSADYTGYVHCCGHGCPACAKGIRVQTKLFIPLYNLDAKEIQFFDRSVKFEPVLADSVFSKYPNPSEYIFRITREGMANDVNTKYLIQAKYTNTIKSFDQICNEYNVSFPAYYEQICKDVNADTLDRWINSAGESSAPELGEMPNYTVSPRAASLPAADQPIMNAEVAPSSIPDDIAEALDELDAPDFGD